MTHDLSYVQAVNEALRWALRESDAAVFFGEDVALPGGVFGASKGLREEFGKRVFDTPISESAILGAAVGAAMRGLRPIVEIMFGDFLFVAFDQLVNQAAHVRYVSKGQLSCPMTVRTQAGVTAGSCAQHTRAVEGFLTQVPGLRVCMPSGPREAYELLRTAVACDDPVVVIENRTLYATRAEVDLNSAVKPIECAHVLRRGRDVTVVAWSRMVNEALAAAQILHSEDHIDAEVIGLSWLNPLDLGEVLDSVERTGRILIAHDGGMRSAMGADVAARVSGEGFWSLDAPVARVTALDVPIPAAPPLQAAALPSAEAIVHRIRGLLEAEQM